MGRVGRYKRAKRFQYGFGKEPDMLGPEGKNVLGKGKDMPASLRRMMLAQEKVKEHEEKKRQRQAGQQGNDSKKSDGAGQPDAGNKKRKAAASESETSDGNQHQKKQKTEAEAKQQEQTENEEKPERIKFGDMRPGESYQQFTRRIRQETRKALQDKDMEEKKGISKARKQKLKEKEMKRKLRKAAKKENDDGAFKDSVKFGEVAQAPPSLTAKPKVKKPAAVIAANALRQQANTDTKSPKKKMTKEEKKEERERKRKMTEEEKEKEREREEKELREKRAKQLLLARVMEKYKLSKEQKKQHLKELDPSAKREVVHYL